MTRISVNETSPMNSSHTISRHPSLWSQTGKQNASVKTMTLNGETITADIAVVGAGITGLTAALLLQKAGRQVVILEADQIASGVSGFNSGHLTSLLLDMRYKTVLANFGEVQSRIVAQAVQQSITHIEQNVRDYRIDCDFKRVPGYLYCEKASQESALNDEFKATETVGLAVNRVFPVSNVPLPMGIESAFIIEQQALIHPQRYVMGLAHEFVELGGRIVVNARVTELSQKAPFTVSTASGQVVAQEVVLATHTPIGLRPALQTRLEPLQSYVIGVRVGNHIPDALFWDMDEPYHYIRVAKDEQGPLLIIGGEDHKTGARKDTRTCFSALEAYARERFDVQSIEYHWSAELLDPADGLPYIGKISNVYVATGLSGEGLTFGTLAGQLISDDILGRENSCAKILNPNRVKPVASAASFLSENVDTALHWIGDRLSPSENAALVQLQPEHGVVIQYEHQKVAAYRDGKGEVHLMSAVCPHMGCIVDWNTAEQSWDCPCHGGRFDCKGALLNGPPMHDLKPLQ
jgi:glycine/D-amino acid oxidase-like deaminating enzyme/nitrite reductase/ring-hydroxylating ferredoxin subunit